MITTQEDIIKIKELFQEMSSKEDFLNLLNFTKKFLYPNNYYAFTERQLNYYISRPAKNTKAYYSFEINKKSGGVRNITAPAKGLKQFQRVLNEILQTIFTPHRAATGFVPGKSIVDNASQHVGKNYVYNLDLKDFFPSIDAERIWGRLLFPPFNLGNTNERRQIANMIKALCTTYLEVERWAPETQQWKKELRNVLPQGAPTSPFLSNAVCEKMDRRLTGVAKSFNLTYTRYADDITFSSMHNRFETGPDKFEPIFVPGSTFDQEIRRIISDQNFTIKESKVRLQKRGYRQEVTGLTVNEKPNVSRRYIKQLRHWIYFCEKFGYKKATGLYSEKYKQEKSHIRGSNIPSLKDVLDGKLLYLKMVKGETDPTFIKLYSRFKKLEFPVFKSRFDLGMPEPAIVDLIHTVGLDKAMELYEI